MAWLRYGSKLGYVEGTSENYVYSSVGDFMEDYGEPISDPGLANMLCGLIEDHPDLENYEKIYFMKKLCERLNVKLRKGVEVVHKI